MHVRARRMTARHLIESFTDLAWMSSDADCVRPGQCNILGIHSIFKSLGKVALEREIGRQCKNRKKSGDLPAGRETRHLWLLATYGTWIALPRIQWKTLVFRTEDEQDNSSTCSVLCYKSHSIDRYSMQIIPFTTQRLRPTFYQV